MLISASSTFLNMSVLASAQSTHTMPLYVHQPQLTHYTDVRLQALAAHVPSPTLLVGHISQLINGAALLQQTQIDISALRHEIRSLAQANGLQEYLTLKPELQEAVLDLAINEFFFGVETPATSSDVVDVDTWPSLDPVVFSLQQTPSTVVQLAADDHPSQAPASNLVDLPTSPINPPNSERRRRGGTIANRGKSEPPTLHVIELEQTATTAELSQLAGRISFDAAALLAVEQYPGLLTDNDPANQQRLADSANEIRRNTAKRLIRVAAEGNFDALQTLIIASVEHDYPLGLSLAFQLLCRKDPEHEILDRLIEASTEHPVMIKALVYLSGYRDTADLEIDFLLAKPEIESITAERLENISIDAFEIRAENGDTTAMDALYYLYMVADDEQMDLIVATLGRLGEVSDYAANRALDIAELESRDDLKNPSNENGLYVWELLHEMLLSNPSAIDRLTALVHSPIISDAAKVLASLAAQSLHAAARFCDLLEGSPRPMPESLKEQFYELLTSIPLIQLGHLLRSDDVKTAEQALAIFQRLQALNHPHATRELLRANNDNDNSASSENVISFIRKLGNDSDD